MPSTTRTKNARGTGPRLREELISAAIRLIDETNDSTSLTLRGIARAAGISAPSIYPHFADLPSLVDSVLAASFTELTQDVAMSIANEPNPARALKAACATYVHFGWNHRARYRLMFAASGYAPNAVEVFDTVKRAIDACVTAGSSTSVDPRGDAYLLWLSMHGMATLEKPGRAEMLRLGPLDRAAILITLVERMARLSAES